MEIPYHFFVSDSKILGLGQGFLILAKYNLALKAREKAREGQRKRPSERALISQQCFANFTHVDMHIFHATSRK